MIWGSVYFFCSAPSLSYLRRTQTALAFFFDHNRCSVATAAIALRNYCLPSDFPPALSKFTKVRSMKWYSLCSYKSTFTSFTGIKGCTSVPEPAALVALRGYRPLAPERNSLHSTYKEHRSMTGLFLLLLATVVSLLFVCTLTIQRHHILCALLRDSCIFIHVSSISGFLPFLAGQPQKKKDTTLLAAVIISWVSDNHSYLFNTSSLLFIRACLRCLETAAVLTLNSPLRLWF